MDLDRFKKTNSQSDDGQAQAWASWLRDEPLPTPDAVPNDAPQTAAANPQPAPTARPVASSNGEAYRRPHAMPQRRPSTPSTSVPTPVSPSTPVQTAAEPTPVAQAPGAGTTPVATTNVSININLPKFTRPSLPKLPYKRIGIGLAALAVLIGIGLTVRYFIDAAATRHKAYEAAHAVTLNKYTTKPTFTPVVPKDGSEQVAKTAAFDGSRDSYSFSDYLNGTQLLVSQQPVPATFDSAQEAVIKIAKSMKATTPLVTKGMTAYQATDKSGSQTVVFAVNNVLLFIQSPFQHDTNSWISYLNTLK